MLLPLYREIKIFKVDMIGQHLAGINIWLQLIK